MLKNSKSFHFVTSLPCLFIFINNYISQDQLIEFLKIKVLLNKNNGFLQYKKWISLIINKDNK